ncbi:hypothetical protein CA606_20090 [Caulobacter vibrioides]|uniref:Uncharacterized protein n=1 Tax=Caulobacter vibrioides TaxID=155892 RepID=A0A2S1B7R8_CAUVI|nr:hypothetical protein CA606_20090 [Caulobacter vibrioides]
MGRWTSPQTSENPCHPGSLAEAIRDPGAARTAFCHPLGPGSPPRLSPGSGRDDNIWWKLGSL